MQKIVLGHVLPVIQGSVFLVMTVFAMLLIVRDVHLLVIVKYVKMNSTLMVQHVQLAYQTVKIAKKPLILQPNANNAYQDSMLMMPWNVLHAQ